ALEVTVDSLPGRGVGVEVVRVVGERRNRERVAAHEVADMFRIEGLDVDVRDAGVPPPLAAGGRPARDLQRVESVLVRPPGDLLERQVRKGGGEKSELHRTTSTHRPSRELRVIA